MNNRFQSRVWFITGGTGLIGGTLISKLLESDVQIIAMIRKNTPIASIEKLNDSGVKLFYGDLEDIDSFKFHLGTADIVVHTAAAVQQADERNYWKVNYQGTRNVVSAMKQFGVRRIIHISTAGVYGQSSMELIHEELSPTPVGEYSKSKFAAEKVLMDSKNNLDITIFRPPYVIGKPDLDRHVLPTLTTILQRRVLPRLWKRDNKIGFVHARDIASAVILAGSMETTPSIYYNIQSFAIPISQIILQGNIVFDIKTNTVPLPYSFVKGIALLFDTFMMILQRESNLAHRIQTFKHSWSLNTNRLENELMWSSQYQDPDKLFILLSKKYSGDKDGIIVGLEDNKLRED